MNKKINLNSLVLDAHFQIYHLSNELEKQFNIFYLINDAEKLK